MASVIASNSHNSWRWRLLLSYLTVMVAILSVSTAIVYEFTRHSLYNQLDRRLENLAQAASHSLLGIKKHYAKQPNRANLNAPTYLKTDRYLDNDGDLDIPWQRLREADQGVQWYDEKGRLIGNAGTLFQDLPPNPGFKTSDFGKIRAVTLTVYDKKPHQIIGYIRTNESTDDVEAILSRMRWGLAAGGTVILCLTGLGGIWLTRQSLKPIETSFQQLKQFTADAAHELRSPLAAQKTSIQVMQYYPERIHPQNVKKVAAIASTTDYMIRLVEDLLLLARMDVEDVAINRESSDIALDKLLIELLESFEAQAEEKAIELLFNFVDPATVKGDVKQLTRLLRNLLDNALHYTRAGGTVEVSLKCRHQSAFIAVKDAGIGIAPEDLKFVFDRFWRADKARSRRESGMGMGLAIAQAIAKQHRGEITVTSELQVGSCFQLRLPSI